MQSFFCVLNKASDKKTKAIRGNRTAFYFIPFTNLKKIELCIPTIVPNLKSCRLFLKIHGYRKSLLAF